MSATAKQRRADGRPYRVAVSDPRTHPDLGAAATTAPTVAPPDP
ncbi:hypothetical protein [Actinoplanes nipponensis]